MRTTTLRCPEHPTCIARLVVDPDNVIAELVPPDWATTWFGQQSGVLVAISHIDAEMTPTGLFPVRPDVMPEPEPEPEADAEPEPEPEPPKRRWFRRRREPE